MDAKESEVRDLFQRCGKIKSLSLGKDKKTGKFRYTFHYIKFHFICVLNIILSVNLLY